MLDYKIFIKSKFLKRFPPEGSDSRVWSIATIRVDGGGGALEGRTRLVDGLLDEVVGDAPRRVLVENGVHQGDLGRAASCLGLCRAVLEAAEATASGQRHVANVRLTVGWHRLVDDQGSVLQVRPARQFHLPEFLERLNDVDCREGEGEREGQRTRVNTRWTGTLTQYIMNKFGKCFARKKCQTSSAKDSGIVAVAIAVMVVKRTIRSRVVTGEAK